MCAKIDLDLKLDWRRRFQRLRTDCICIRLSIYVNTFKNLFVLNCHCTLQFNDQLINLF